MLFRSSTQIAEDFIATVESAIATLISDPMRWRIVEEPEVRRYFLSRFPYVIYYRWERERVAIYAVMHCSREPGYWHHRLPAA